MVAAVAMMINTNVIGLLGAKAKNGFEIADGLFISTAACPR